MSTLVERVHGTSQQYTVTRSPNVGLGIVMKEAMLEIPGSTDSFPVIIITELKQDGDAPGPAMTAGVEVGDIVVSVGDPPVDVSNFEEFGNCVRDHNDVLLHILRADKQPADDKPAEAGAEEEGSAAAAATAAAEADGTVGSGEVSDVSDTPGEDRDSGYVSEEDLMESEDGVVDDNSAADSDNYVEGSFEFEDEDEDETTSDGAEYDAEAAEKEQDRIAAEAAAAKAAAASSAATAAAAQATTSETTSASAAAPVAPSPLKPPHKSRATVDLKGDEPLEIIWRGTKEIAAGQMFTVPINISFPFGRLKWGFELDGADVEFSILPQGKHKNKRNMPSVPKKRMASGQGASKVLSGELVFDQPVMLQVVWSNEYSWMKGKKVTYTLRVDDDALREKKKALTNTIRGLFQSTIGGGGDAASQREQFSTAVQNVPTELRRFDKLPQIKLHALQRIKFEVEQKMARLAKQATALRQVAANTQVAYDQDIARISALVEDDSIGDDDIAKIANRIELEVFVEAYKSGFAHLAKREKSVRAENAAAQQELDVISASLEQLAVVTNLKDLSAESSP